jgi:hypothetical protein
MKHIKPAPGSSMRDIKAALAAKFADAAGRDAELNCVCEMLEVDEDAARNLIAQGRRLLRLKREGVAL